MIKRVLFFALISVFLCSCTKDCREVISFASWGSVTETGIIKKTIADFENENPKIKINFIHIPQNYFQKLHLMFASNTPPDVIFINNLYLPVYAKHLENLSDYIDKEEYYPQAVSGMSYEGKQFGFPRDISNLVFYVNLDKTILPASDWILSNLLNKCSDIKNRTDFCISYEDSIYWALPYLSYFGGGILDRNLDFIADSIQSETAINFYKDLKNKHHYAPSKSQVGSSTLAQMFLDGKIVFYLSGRWMYPKISEKARFNWAVINFPYGLSPQPCDVSGWAVSKSSKHKAAAIKFVQYIASEKTSEYFTQTGLIVPARKAAAQKLNNKKHNEKVFLEVIKKSENTPVSKNYNKLTDKLNKQLDL